jgi:hypothetical protein
MTPNPMSLRKGRHPEMFLLENHCIRVFSARSRKKPIALKVW